MRIVIDTNVLVSTLLATTSLPAELMIQWRHGRFELLTSDLQLDELVRVTRYPKIKSRLSPALAGRLVNDVRRLGIVMHDLPPVTISPDPFDNYLLATAAAGRADFLVTGDRRDLLHLKRFAGTRIVTVRDFLGTRSA